MKKHAKHLGVCTLACALLVGMLPTASAATHTVSTGEWLSTIAPKYNTTWEILAEINNLSNPDLIFPDQVLTLPETTEVAEVVEEETAGIYVVTQIEDGTVYEAVGHYDVTPTRLHKAADVEGAMTVGLSYFEPGGGADMAVTTAEMIYYVIEGEMTITTDDGETYILQDGDSIHFGVGVGRQPVNTYDGVSKMLVASCATVEGATEGLYTVVYAEDATPYEAVGHYDVTPTRLHNAADVEGRLTVGLSHFDPDGGADMADTAVEMIYYVVDGEMTITTGDGQVHDLQNDDSIHFGIGVGRQPTNTYDGITQMLVISCATVTG